MNPISRRNAIVTEETSQWVQCLLRSVQTSAGAQRVCKKVGVAAGTYNPNAGEVETGGSLGLMASRPSLLNE